MKIDDAVLRSSLEELAERPAPPFAIDAPAAIARARRLVRRRRGARAGGGAAVLALAAVAALAAVPGHGAVSAAPAAPAVKPVVLGPGSDPLTLSGTFGWLPDDAQNVNYSLHEGPDGTMELQAAAKGAATVSTSAPAEPAMIWLTIYPKGTTPQLGRFADEAAQLRIDAPDVNGHTAYWMSKDANDPTNHGDTWLRWQDADGQWGELHAYDLGKEDIAATLLRVASGVDFAPHAVPLPLRITGIPAAATADEAELDRGGLLPDGYGDWSVHLALSAGGGMIEVDVFPTTAAADAAELSQKPEPACTHQGGLTGCVVMPGKPVRVERQYLAHLTLLGTDPAGWTTHVVAR